MDIHSADIGTKQTQEAKNMAPNTTPCGSEPGLPRLSPHSVKAYNKQHEPILTTTILVGQTDGQTLSPQILA